VIVTVMLLFNVVYEVMFSMLMLYRLFSDKSTMFQALI